MGQQKYPDPNKLYHSTTHCTWDIKKLGEANKLWINKLLGVVLIYW